MLKGQRETGEWVRFKGSDIESATRDYTEIITVSGEVVNDIIVDHLRLGAQAKPKDGK